MNIGKKVLFAENDMFLSGMYHDKLAFEGYDVHVASGGQEAMDKIAEHLFDILLLNAEMPKPNGFEILKMIRGDMLHPYAGVPVIIITHSGSREHIERGLLLGANDFFIKGSHKPHEILDKIKALIG